jgi:glycosyltransferase involved in cell wall biosynthesis
MPIEKALLATINYDHPQLGMIDAFQKVFGHGNVIDCDYFHSGGESPDGMLVRMAREHRPDWIWLQVQDSNKITADAIKQIRAELPGTVVTHWTGDLRPQVSHYLGTICEATHATFCSSVGQIDMFKKAGASLCQYVQIGLDWDEDVAAPHRPPPFPVPDVVFCGGYYGEQFPGTKQRVEAILALKRAGIGIGVVGQGWSAGGYNVLGHCHVKEQCHVWRAAKICLNVNHFNHVPLYYSDRQLIAMASGRPTVCHYVPMLEQEFENWTHCVWYRNPGELVEVVQALLRDPEMQTRIGTCGKNEVIANHTWEARIRVLLPTIEELRP